MHVFFYELYKYSLGVIEIIELLCIKPAKILSISLNIFKLCIYLYMSMLNFHIIFCLDWNSKITSQDILLRM